MLGAGLVEDIPYPGVIVVVGPSGETDPMACRNKDCRIGHLPRVDEVTAVDHG